MTQFSIRPFDQQSLHVRQECAKSLWHCAQVACPHGVSKTSLTQKAADSLDISLAGGRFTPGWLTKTRYEEAIKHCIDDRPPPPPALGAIFAEGVKPIEFYWDLDNWFSPLAPSSTLITVLGGLAALALRPATAIWNLITPPPPSYFEKPNII